MAKNTRVPPDTAKTSNMMKSDNNIRLPKDMVSHRAATCPKGQPAMSSITPISAKSDGRATKPAANLRDEEVPEGCCWWTKIQ